MEPSKDSSAQELDLVAQRTLKDMRYVIFPHTKWIKRWDALNAFLLFLLAFIIPYEVGVTGAYYIAMNAKWFAVHVMMDAVFTVDTFLYFFRAYPDNDGRLIFSLPKIRTRYLKTYFIPNLISNFPGNVIIYIYAWQHMDTFGGENVKMVIAFKILDVLKVLRFLRLKIIMKRSDIWREIRKHFSTTKLHLTGYFFLMVLVAHWFACIWCLVAYYQVGGFDASSLCETPNWIGNWCTGTYGDCEPAKGGLNPLGWTNDLQRYVLSLFWSIQTITSIGYGNIAPFTPVEWWASSALMLLSGILWTYIIGGLVGVVAMMQEDVEAYGARFDQANQMIKQFVKDENDEDNRSTIIARRLRKYIHDQRAASNSKACVGDLGTLYPVYDSLSPHLKQMSSLMILKNDLESVTYLSSQFLSMHEQASVAVQCKVLEFGRGEVVDIDNIGIKDLDRGIFVFRRGLAFGYDYYSKDNFRSVFLTKGRSFGCTKVLIEAGSWRAKARLKFLTFSTVTFIPRKAVSTVLNTNERAWKECGRWRYLRAMLQSKNNHVAQRFPSNMFN